MKTKDKTKSKTSKKSQQEENLPGYPPYPPEEDIVRNGTRVEGNLGDEDLETNVTTPLEPGAESATSATPYDVTNEDIEALSPEDLSMDLGEDEQLRRRSHPVDFAGEDLDVPGAADDDDQENVGSEDEENNNYSVGGDGHSDLEEGRP